jgi:hypothetical protein
MILLYFTVLVTTFLYPLAESRLEVDGKGEGPPELMLALADC